MIGLHRKYLLFRSKVAILVEDMQSNIKVPFRIRIKCISKGFLSRSYFLYDLKNNNYKDYISDYERKKTRFINGDNAVILNNKIIFDNMTNGYIKTPAIYSVILDGKIYPYTNKTNESLICSSEELIAYIKNKGKVVLKPYINSDGGSGIYICKYLNGNIYFNDTIFKEENIKSLIDSLNKYIVTEYIEQHEYSAKIFRESVNTIRIITMEDPYTQEIFIPIAVHRFGTSEAGNVDNWNKGGLSAEVDIDTGILGKATRKPMKNEMEWYSNHPDTGEQIEGVKIPKWELIVKKILSLAKGMPFLKYVGWDVVVTKDGNILIIEANNCSGVNVLQVHRPLLTDSRVEKFYKYYKII
ncbi:hypothetical protein FYJ27_11655 [Anaerosalibacter bizertensis]|uniref:Alpha-L-glutamate ligase-related protein ATP-grasp domain-containing protein n=1 Tax=Anaerosalibacter bizertensis TaxID=932217 RepID=A0A844FKI4_9FIRM|nr:sugar-transfer associated ATP-grasp domain-containing protein [Anaerosalibacter bizertensis]MSS44355.1 hypothetical protein [Anaerosalibacter bizertensis]